MNLLHLHYFYVVAKEGGFTKASILLRIQQPAISRMVKQLEESMEISLFEKIGRNIRLTLKGREVFEHCKKIFSNVNDLENAIGQMKADPKGPLFFGASEPIASHLVPNIIEKIMKVNPNLYPNVYSAPASMLFDQIKNGDLEFGLFFHVPELPNGLKLSVIKKVRFYLVIRKDLKLNNQTLESFIGSREIDDRSTKNFPALAKLRKLYPKAQIKISSNNLTAHRSLVLRGCGVSVLPNFLIQQDLDKGKLVDILPHEKLEYDLKIITRTHSVLSQNAQCFLSEI